MKESPVLFKSEMINAIIAGTKTQTRRVITKPNEVVFSKQLYPVQNVPDHLMNAWDIWLKCPYGQVGNNLWVRETWAQLCNHPDLGCEYEGFFCDSECKYFQIEYRADTNNPYPGEWPKEEAKGNPDAPKWKPSIHMPKKYCRLWLKVLSVKVERVQEISVDDIMAEGVEDGYFAPIGIPEEEHKKLADHIMIQRWIELWDSINKKRGYGWDANPWVWVIEFEKLEGRP